MAESQEEFFERLARDTGIPIEQVREHHAAIANDPLVTPRSADRIGRICEKLALVWSQNPDQRLGQLLSNYAFGHHVDIWHQEDTDTEANLDEFLNAPVEQRQCPHPGVFRGEVCPKCGGTFG